MWHSPQWPGALEPPHGHDRARRCLLCREGTLALRALRTVANLGLRSRLWDRPSAATLDLILDPVEEPRLLVRGTRARRRGKLLPGPGFSRARRGTRRRAPHLRSESIAPPRPDERRLGR
jgi:hypothetical protein